MKSVKIRIAGKEFELASRTQRFWAFFTDALMLFVATLILYWVLGVLGVRTWYPNIFSIASLLLWLFGLSFIEGFNGLGPGRAMVNIRVLRLKDGRPSNFTDAFFRRLTLILLPLDLIWTLGEKRQRLGDQLTSTVVVKLRYDAKKDINFGPPAPEASIKIAGKTFELGDRLARLFAFFIDVLPLLLATLILRWLASLVSGYYIIEHDYPFDSAVMETSRLVPMIGIVPIVFYSVTIGLWILGLLFMDGVNGRSLGKTIMKLRVLRLQDGKPCDLKSSALRRLTIILQPFDIIWALRQKRQRIGDRLAGTIVVKYDATAVVGPRKPTPEEVLKIVGKDSELADRSARSPEQSIRIAGKAFELGARLARFFAFFTDVLLLLFATGTLRLLAAAASTYYLQRAVYSEPSAIETSGILSMIGIPPMVGIVPTVFYTVTIGLWILGLFLMDGFNGRSPGKALIGIQVLRLKDGKPCNLRNAFLRRLTIILQPFDFIAILGQKRQRIGDRLAGTVVVAATAAQVVPVTEPSIRIARENFELAPLKLRLPAFLIDLSCLLYIYFFFTFIAYPALYTALSPLAIFQPMSLGLWIFGVSLFLIDGFNGRGFGKRVMSIQVVRLKDGRPGNFKDSALRRVASVLLPLDLIPSFGKKRQRIGDKLAGTVVVKLAPEVVIVDVASETRQISDPEEVLGIAILEMNSRLTEAREQVDASIKIEKQFQTSYENAVYEAEQCQARAVAALQAEGEDAAREALQERNKYRRLAEGYKKQYEEQKQVVQSFTNTLEYLQRKMMEAQVKKAIIVAQHRNSDAQTHLRKMLAEIEDSEPFETLVETEQRVTKEAALEKAAAEMETAYQDTELEREFTGPAEDTAIDKELAELKSKLR